MTVSALVVVAVLPGGVYFVAPVGAILLIALFGLQDLLELRFNQDNLHLSRTRLGRRGVFLLAIAAITSLLLLPFAPIGARLRDSTGAETRLIHKIESTVDQILNDAEYLIATTDINARINGDSERIPSTIRDLNPLSISNYGERLVMSMKPGDNFIHLELVTRDCTFNAPNYREPGVWLIDTRRTPFRYTRIRELNTNGRANLPGNHQKTK